jgi:hypothetical protein
LQLGAHDGPHDDQRIEIGGMLRIEYLLDDTLHQVLPSGGLGFAAGARDFVLAAFFTAAGFRRAFWPTCRSYAWRR